MEVKRSESIAALAAALAKAQGEFTAARFDAVNPFLKNRYASLGSIIETAKPIMAKNGLSVTQPVTGDGSNIAVNTILLHSSGEWIESTMSLPLVEERGKSQAQAAGSVITYLRRYALAAMLGIYADADTDGQEEQRKPKAEPQPTPQERADQAAADLGFAPKPPAKVAIHTAQTGPTVKIGKNTYPMEWGKRFAAEGLYNTATPFEVDGILQKLELPAGAGADVAHTAVSVYLEAKAEGGDPLQAANDYLTALMSGLTEKG